jgi:hypothetical protein
MEAAAAAKRKAKEDQLAEDRTMLAALSHSPPRNAERGGDYNGGTSNTQQRIQPGRLPATVTFAQGPQEPRAHAYAPGRSFAEQDHGGYGAGSGGYRANVSQYDERGRYGGTKSSFDSGNWRAPEAGDQYGITMQPSAMSQLNGQDSLRHGAPENNSLSANQQRGSLSPPRNVPDFTALGSVRLRCRLEWSSQSVAVFSQACWLLTHRCNFSLNPVVLVCISSSTGMHQFTNGAHHDMLCRAAQRCSAGWRMWRAT